MRALKYIGPGGRVFRHCHRVNKINAARHCYRVIASISKWRIIANMSVASLLSRQQMSRHCYRVSKCRASLPSRKVHVCRARHCYREK